MAGDQRVVEIASITGADDARIDSTLAQFRARKASLTLRERQRLVEQARVLFEQIYVHLPLKKAMHAVDPVQRLRLLEYRADKLTDRQFHDELLGVFNSVRDLHTNYILPDPYRTKTAFIPFLVEEYYEQGRRRYVVSKLIAGFSHETFKPGVQVHHWNGAQFDNAVAVNADKEAGSNEDARHARGLEAMTIRPLSMSLPPDEDWVVIGYTGEDGADHEIRFDWQIFEPDPAPQGVRAGDASNPAAWALGIDAGTEAVRRAKKALFAPKAMQAERAVAVTGAAPTDESILPDVLSFKTVVTPSGTFGYIRIWTFDVSDKDVFVNEVIRIAGLLPQDGLILDVRGNGGGVIVAGERLLQLLTPKPIDPCRLHFLNTQFTLDLCKQNAPLAAWVPSIEQAVETGAAFSFGFPVLPAEEYNDIGQRYVGPVVLVTDALCYSTTDIFSAGFQDHGIGPILGTNGNTGAGGANVWDHDLLSQLQPPGGTIKPLPKNANFRVAIRRTTRVGARSGVPLEDLGVVPDTIHQMTRRDVVGSNEDLINAAGELLAARPAYALSASAKVKRGHLEVTARTAKLTRLDLAVDGRPVASDDVKDGEHTLTATVGRGRHVVDLRGYDGDTLAAAAKLRV